MNALKRMLAIVMITAMSVVYMPLLPGVNGTAAAAEAVSYRYPEYNKTDGSFYENASSGIKVWHEDGSCTTYTEIKTDQSTSQTWNAGWYVVTGADVKYTNGIVISGVVHLILADGAKLTVTVPSGNASAGINVTGDNTLTIYGQIGGTGELNTTGGNITNDSSGAGIGGNGQESGSNITINGGTVTATGGYYAAGIGGGGAGGDGNYITINGGKVTATGVGGGGAGIGGGFKGNSQNITINGGEITATGVGGGGAGIGGGYGWGDNPGNSQNITITGGTVTATGSSGGAGIGGGRSGVGSDITITGGTVTATGSSSGGKVGAGIGSGQYSSVSASNIKIAAELCVKADDTNPPTTEITHTSDQDIASVLASKMFVLIEVTADPKADTNEVKSANTADTNDIAPWALLMLMSVMGLAGYGLKRRNN